MKAFKTFAQCPSNQKPHNQIPESWPWQISDCEESETELLESQGFTVLSDEEYEAYLTNNQATYDAWLLIYRGYLSTNAEYLSHTVSKTKQWADALMDKIKVMNIQGGDCAANGIWLHNRLRAITITVQQSHVDAFAPLAPLLGITITVDLINMISTGDAESVFGIFCCLTPDDMTQPYHALSQTFINYVKSEIAAYLGWA